MRHGVAFSSLNRDSKSRMHMLRVMVTQLIKHERITTTHAKAKAIQPLAEKMVTLAKDGTLHSRRQALAFVNEPALVTKLFNEFAPRYRERSGGYTRVLRNGTRLGDRAPQSVIEFVDSPLGNTLAPSKERKFWQDFYKKQAEGGQQQTGGAQ
ncbi:50S ribosomal protein L17 [Fonticula alba]|uniref:50S ribosomal protein L17 n=1 Tax=Fonticula alba TaxID=691883 RepID=A0A058Z283_FONAL|nr:50S ribosomal protein L17 [Fonticula alba]KCV67627.1 50S ribosomal protein L17 [Fonticula alba]|eukprot:XP_009497965.1 50S ribosomal protein L17 [Fonticula alba]